MAQSKTDFAQQAAAAQEVLRLGEEVKTITAQQKGHCDATVSIWQGDGQTSYLQGSAEYHSELDKFSTLVDDIGQKIGTAGVKYEGVNSGVATKLASFGQ